MGKLSLAAIHKIALAALLAATVLSFQVPAHASNLVTNGSFELTTLGSPGGQATFGTGTACTGGDILDWCQGEGGTTATAQDNGTNALALLYYPGDQTDTLSDQFSGGFSMWQGITNTIPNASPDGGNYLVVDGAQNNNLSIYQTINGLVANANYVLTFYWAAGQQNGFTGATTEQWQVTFGSQTQSTAIVNDPSHDFQPWTKVTMTFKASATSQVLTFLALGTPVNDPPMVFIDGVNMVQVVPEPSTIAIAGIGICALLLLRRRRIRTGVSVG